MKSWCLFGGPLASLALALSAAAPAVAQAPARPPVQVLKHAPIAAPVDHAFKGVIEVDIDATDVARKLFVVRQVVPVQNSTTLTLLYPRWEAASHGPSLSITALSGLIIEAKAQRVAWRRDPVDPHAIHVDLPKGVKTVELRFQIIADGEQLSPDAIKASWQRLVLYPAGWYARNILVSPKMTLPPGIRPVTALPIKSAQGDVVAFSTVTLETLLDSPVYGARHLAKIALASAPEAVTLNVMAGRADDLAVPPERLQELRRMIAQSRKVFGPAPFGRYDFLAQLADDGWVGGAEHRRSSEISLPSSYFRDWGDQLNGRDIIAHEFAHAWNGLYRTPADLWTATPNQPQGGSLLWVYEGQTEFWGRILAARAGLRDSQETLDQLALDAALTANRPGRAWRSLADDVNYGSFMLRQPTPWEDWQRRKDYYREGVMLWLFVDATLREQTGGSKGLDDFARLFFAGASDTTPTRTYDFTALCAALNAVSPHDWAAELRRWIEAHQELDTSVGLAKHGWRLTYSTEPTATFRQFEEEEGVTDLTFSIGLTVRANGVVRSVAWDGPAFKAGLAPRAKIVAVQDQPFSPERLVEAVRTAHRTPVRLTVEQDGRQATQSVAYDGTLRYPRLARIEGAPDGLSRLLAPQ